MTLIEVCSCIKWCVERNAVGALREGEVVAGCAVRFGVGVGALRFGLFELGFIDFIVCCKVAGQPTKQLRNFLLEIGDLVLDSYIGGKFVELI